MYRKIPNLVIGFHGCKKEVFQKVIVNGEHLIKSTNSYDWLGNGIYFWEQNYQRALEWAQTRYKDDAAVIGAVIDLGYCLNLTDSISSDYLRKGYEYLKATCELTGNELPKNRTSKSTSDILLRDLDCAVIQHLHELNEKMGYTEFDSVRGLFTEGGPPYEGSAFFEKSHVQLCIRNTNCIKGYFNPLTRDDNYPLP